MNKSRREIIIQFLKFISETKLIFRFLDSRQESDTKLVSFFRRRSRRDAFRLVPQTVEFRLRRPTRRQGVAWPRFRAARIPFFFVFSTYPPRLFASFSPFASNFPPRLQFAWTACAPAISHRSVIVLESDTDIRPATSEAPLF